MGKMNFGFTAVQAGQKSTTINAEPRLIANSTLGKFMITSPVSKALGVAVGENIMFLNNISEVEAAIVARHEVITSWAAENGADLDTREGQEAALKNFTMWAIAKGVLQYNAKGEPVMGNVRYTKEEKIAFVVANMDQFLADEATRTGIGEVMQNADFTAEDLLAVLNSDEDTEFVNAVKDAVVSCVQSPQYHTATGSKTATTGSATGVGCQLSFTDTAIWNALKADLKDDMDKKNRNFNVILADAFETEVSNGQTAVKIMAYPIEFIDDTDPIRRTDKE